MSFATLLEGYISIIRCQHHGQCKSVSCHSSARKFIYCIPRPSWTYGQGHRWDCIFSQYTGGNPPHQDCMDSKDNKCIGRRSLEWFLPLLVPLPPSPPILTLHLGSCCCWSPPTVCCCCSCFQIGFASSSRQTGSAVAGSDWQMRVAVLEGRQLCEPCNISTSHSE